MKKLTFVLVLLLTVAVAMPAQANFPDVSEDHWAYGAVTELQAAGIVEGFPDGEYKGQQNLTRYEMALFIARMLDDLNYQLDSLDYDIEAIHAEIDDLSEGLTAAQADDVAAIVQAMLEEQVPEREEGLTAEQSEQVVNLIRALTAEFNTELRMLRDDLGAMEAFAHQTEENTELIADLEERMDVMETVQFRGEYSVDFEHDVLVDGDTTTVTDGADYVIEDWPTYLDNFEGNEETFNTKVEYVTFVRNWLDNYTVTDEFGRDAVAAFNAEVPAKYEIQDTVNTSDYLFGWEGNESYAVPSEDTGFSQSLTLGADIYTDLFEASIDINIDDDEFDLTDTVLEIDAGDWQASFAPANTVSQRDFSVNSEDIKGVTFDYNPWGIETFFGEVTEADGATTDVRSEFSYDNDDNEWVSETSTATNDYYLLGASLTQEFAGFELGGSYAMRTDQFEFTDDENLGMLGLDMSTSIDNVDFGADFGYSLPFDENDDAGMLLRANADASLEELVDLSANFRFRDENFSPLYGDDTVFDFGDDDFDRFDDGIGEDAMAFGVRADQQMFDFLTAGYAEFNMYNHDRANDGLTDYNVLVGGGMPLFVDGLEGSASFERRFYDDYDENLETALDRVKAGANYDKSPFELSTSFEMLMHTQEAWSDAENWMIFGADGSFEVIENVSLLGNFEMDQNLLFVEDVNKTTFGIGAEAEEIDSGFYDIKLSANAMYSMQNWDFNNGDEESTTIELGAGVDREVGKLTLSNHFTYTDKSGDVLMLDKSEKWHEGYYDVADYGMLYDGTKLENVFGLEYEIVEDTNFTLDYTETFFNINEDGISDDFDWNTRKIEAGVTISF